ncbi:MAG: SpoIID/LytB domain-containing protein [Bacteroidia bacterium]|jgi:stage II sporulation protein D|nr:SpoIID/LytB domain-containing protein [Bacteroidia bacterium]
MLKARRKIVVPLLLALVFGLFSSFFVPAEFVYIRLFAHLKLNEFEVMMSPRVYRILADGSSLELDQNNFNFKFRWNNDSVQLIQGNEVFGTYAYIKVYTEDPLNDLKIKLIQPDRKIRTYQGNFSCSVFDGGLRIINEILLDNYIAGVTEAEAGSRSSLEFYKVQAILARTFALAHINKHVDEGFNLCDQVHCQAYFGKPRELRIFSAIEATKNKVVVDENLNLITAAFHSNSGGQTANSEDVWGSKTTYLRSVNDSFSVAMPNARWERKMLTQDWLSYLKLKHNYPIEDPSAKEAVLNFRQDERKVFIEINQYKVPLKGVRQDLQLKSTFFSIRPLSNDSIVFTGKGYGHGLGMCQEGAMCMGKKGYTYEQILNFYYQNILLIDLHKLSFFKDE